MDFPCLTEAEIVEGLADPELFAAKSDQLIKAHVALLRVGMDAIGVSLSDQDWSDCESYLASMMLKRVNDVTSKIIDQVKRSGVN